MLRITAFHPQDKTSGITLWFSITALLHRLILRSMSEDLGSRLEPLFNRLLTLPSVAVAVHIWTVLSPSAPLVSAPPLQVLFSLTASPAVVTSVLLRHIWDSILSLLALVLSVLLILCCFASQALASIQHCFLTRLVTITLTRKSLRAQALLP